MLLNSIDFVLNSFCVKSYYNEFNIFQNLYSIKLLSPSLSHFLLLKTFNSSSIFQLNPSSIILPTMITIMEARLIIMVLDNSGRKIEEIINSSNSGSLMVIMAIIKGKVKMASRSKERYIRVIPNKMKVKLMKTRMS